MSDRRHLGGADLDESGTRASGDILTWNATNFTARWRALLTAIAHAMTSTGHTAGNNKVFYSTSSGVVAELTNGANGTLLRFTGATTNPVAGFLATVTNTRTVVVNTAYQPSTTRDVVVCASVEISSGAAGDGKIEALVDGDNPPVTVVGTFRVGTALTVIGSQLIFLVPALSYYQLKTTSTGGTPTFSVVGLVNEVAL